MTTNDISPALTIIVGSAVNWFHRGAYFIRRQLEAQGLSTEEVAQHVSDNLKQNDAIFASSDTLNPSLRPMMKQIDRTTDYYRKRGRDVIGGHRQHPTSLRKPQKANRTAF